VAVGTEPVAAVVVPLVGEAHGDAIAGECPQFLDQAGFLFFLPLSGQERDDVVATIDEFGAVTPLAVDGVSESDLGRVATVPAVLGQTDFLHGGFMGERRYGGSHGETLLDKGAPSVPFGTPAPCRFLLREVSFAVLGPAGLCPHVLRYREQMAVARRLRAQVLLRRMVDLSAELRGGMPRPAWVIEHRTGQGDHVGVAGAND